MIFEESQEDQSESLELKLDDELKQVPLHQPDERKTQNKGEFVTSKHKLDLQTIITENIIETNNLDQ